MVSVALSTSVDHTHPNLAANAWTSTSTINGCPAGTHGYNELTATCNPMDDNHHGTHEDSDRVRVAERLEEKVLLEQVRAPTHAT